MTAAIAGGLGSDVANRLGPYKIDDPGTDTVQTANRLTRASGLETRREIVVLVRTQSGVRTPSGRRRVERVRSWLAAASEIGAVTKRAPPSTDGKATYIVARLSAGATDETAVAQVKRRMQGHPGVTIGGTATANVAVGDVAQADLRRAELLALPLLFLLSVWFFRSLVAAALPLLIGVLSITFTFAALRIAGEVIDLSVFALNLVAGLGLGLAVDYSLFIVSRYREEISQHGPGREALRRTVASAGRTVLFSALTIAAALASLLVFPQQSIYSMGVGGLMVALIAALLAIVVLPAVLALLGERVNGLAPDWLRRAAEAEARGEHGRWYRLATFVMRRPGRVAVASATLLIALALPALDAKFTAIDVSVLPQSEPARQVDTALQREFPITPAAPVIVATRGSFGQAASVARRIRTIAGSEAVGPPARVGPSLWRIDVVSGGEPLSARTQELVRQIRGIDAAGGVGVTGVSADFVDFKSSILDHLPLSLVLLASTTLVLLFFMTGSVVLPFKALLMNALTVSAAFGILVFVFQGGRFEDLLDYASKGALEASQLVVLGAIAFGLSTDYGVFLLSRIKEARDRGASNVEAVATGLERTGRIVTSAALLISVAIGALATSQLGYIKELAIGATMAVLIDATIVRALLVPSLMALLGRWNWWAPRPLRRLHDRMPILERGDRPG